MNILIVDDEALVRTSVKLYLESCKVNKDCIFQAENAQQMLCLLKQQNVDIAFVDIRMPEQMAYPPLKKHLHPIRTSMC